MSHVEIRDRVLWIKHIHGARFLSDKLQKLPAGTSIRLRIGGQAGVWEKMKDKPDGKPTPGLKPVGPVSEYWQTLFRTRRGELIDIEMDSSASPMAQVSDADREAAWAAFVALTKAGWRSSGAKLSRDELHERIFG